MYLQFSTLLCQHFQSDLAFISSLTQTLTLILLTAPELELFRSAIQNGTIKDSATQEGRNGTSPTVFTQLFKSWSYNCISALSLCFLGKHYDLATLLIHRLASSNALYGTSEVAFLMQVRSSNAIFQSYTMDSERCHVGY